MATPRGNRTSLPLQLSGENGNAFSIIARAHRALKAAGKADRIDAFTAEAQSGDYDHLLRTCMRWFDVS